ncbi:MAG: carboxypeptidase-like regulatory domain-containing protein, partial [Bacteroidales bacterium]|nr:carboxypeptidase-like regulatory domain-containing protein [Bacteroidales bacterium]
MKRWICIGIFLLCTLPSTTADTLDQRIYLQGGRGSVYELLKKVSERSQCLFIYEKGVVNNEQRVRIASGSYTIREAILLITGEKDLQMKMIGQYILLFKDFSASLPPPTTNAPSSVFIEGYVKDRQTREALPYSYIVLESTGVGTISNLDGQFTLKVPDSLSSAHVTISHVGYHTPKIPLEVFKGNKPEIFLDPNTIQLQEVVVRYVPAQKIMREMLDNRSKNYAPYPAYFTSFYREGVEYGDHFVSLTEGVCQVYKSGYASSSDDQVKLLKMRNIQNTSYPDSILLKIQAGVRASLSLDVIQHVPGFFAP